MFGRKNGNPPNIFFGGLEKKRRNRRGGGINTQGRKKGGKPFAPD